MVIATEHPRLHGENGPVSVADDVHAGTSPPTRGKPASIRPGSVLHRNIPAYTGKTNGFMLRAALFKEHPRLHGENAISCCNCSWRSGTSPPTRGKLGHVVRARPLRRNIPAYTGKTRRGRCPPASSAEHPRLHGENEHKREAGVDLVGTSPPTRGKRRQSQARGEPVRNIPAYTGKTLRKASSFLSKPSPNPRPHERIQLTFSYAPALAVSKRKSTSSPTREGARAHLTDVTFGRLSPPS